MSIFKYIKYPVLITLHLIIFSIGSSAKVISPPDPLTLLKKILMSDSNIPYIGRQSVAISSASHADLTVTKEYHEGLNRDRIIYLMPRNLSGRMIVNDGENHWEWVPSRSMVIESKLQRFVSTPASILDTLHRVKQSYILKINPHPVSMLGRKAWVLHIIPRYRDRCSRVWWIDTTNSFVLRRDVYNTEGALITTSSYTSIHFLKSKHLSNIRFIVPKNARVIHKDPTTAIRNYQQAIHIAPSWARFPLSLGKGFAFESAELLAIKKTPGIHIQYSDGFSVLSLIQMPGKVDLHTSSHPERKIWIEGRPCTIIEAGSLKILCWNTRHSTYNLVGDMSIPSMVSIAREFE
jgi:negative regulator of sigma E activity